MAFPKGFVRHTLNWTLPGGEVAASSCSWNNTDGPGYLDEDVADALALKGVTLWDAIAGRFADEVAYIGSKASLIAVDGHVVSSYDRTITAVPGEATTSWPLPTEVSVVASLRTTLAGKSYRGRMYLPNMAAYCLASDGRYDPTTTALLSDEVATYCEPFEAGGNDWESVVASATAGVLTAIVNVAVGDVADVQRRRRDALAEVYSISPVT